MLIGQKTGKFKHRPQAHSYWNMDTQQSKETNQNNQKKVYEEFLNREVEPHPSKTKLGKLGNNWRCGCDGKKLYRMHGLYVYIMGVNSVCKGAIIHSSITCITCIPFIKLKSTYVLNINE